MKMNNLLKLTITAAALMFSLTAFAQQSEEERVEALLQQMTLQEKIGQLNQLSVGGFDPNAAGMMRAGMVGSILNECNPKVLNRYQKAAVEESRLGIPLIISRDVIHGFKTMFPIPLGLAATFDPELVEQGARVAAVEATASGIRWTFSPMLDIARDPRWGRIAEGSGEDTYLDAQMGVAMVKGYQGESIDNTSMAACVKHFVAYGAAEGGRDYNSTGVSERTLRNVYLPPFEACVKAGAMTLMTSFNDNDGIPSTGNGFLVNDVLRGEWGFDGFVVSDWASIYEMVNHGFAEDNKRAGELAFNAGVDMDMMSYSYISHMEELINEGKVSMETLDNAVRNILRIKVRLGLFENPYIDESKVESTFYSAEALEAARKSAVESAVLLTNNGVLPLNKSKVKTVLVTGPMADAPHDQLGTWTFDGDPAHTVTPLKAIRDLYGKDVKVIYEPGLTFTREFNENGIAKAVKAAKKADVILAFMGEEAIMSGEAHCLTDITLKGDQRKMIEALHATGKPVVVNIMAGRPLELDFEIAHSDAILYSFHPGTMGGPAITQLIFGDETPSGKTPITFPKNVGQIPIYYNHNMTGRPYNGTETMLYDIPLRAGQTSLGNTSYWLDTTFEPEFPFGYGLTYTTFEYSEPSIEMTEYGAGDVIHACVTLKNTGKSEATEVVQLYVRDMVGSVTRPVKELKGFQRVTVAPGESVTVRFELPVQDLAFYGIDMVKKVEPGKFRLWIAGDSASGKPVEFEVK
ncbi:MAG: beta-glucosidase BglX [Bacteroidales bacterium]|nr:beta-glucosidase BglX [Bacteroidales bacterium]